MYAAELSQPLELFQHLSGEITLVEYVVSLDKLGVHDVEHVGGKNASLGEMISNLAGAGVSVPVASPRLLRHIVIFSN